MLLSAFNSGSRPGRLKEALERDLILSLLEPKSGQRILEVGCGNGNLLQILRKRGLTVTGLESDQTLVKAARDNLDNKDIVEFGEPGELPFEDNAFDLVLLGHIITQALDPGVALAEAGRVARRRLVVKTLNPYSWSGLCGRFQGRSDLEKWLGPWRLASLARQLFGPGNVKRVSLFALPRAWLTWTKSLEMSPLVQRFPFGGVVFLRIDLRYTVRTRPLSLSTKPAALRPTPRPVRRQSKAWLEEAVSRPGQIQEGGPQV